MRRVLLTVGVFFLLCGCEGLRGKLKLFEGNFFYSRGRINEAIGAYLDAAKAGAPEAYTHFAVGSAYLLLEESGAALERFKLAEQTLAHLPENRPLLYRIRYNSAVARFERGEFKEAARDFRGALEVDSSAREAKRNLELCLISLYMKNQATEIKTDSTLPAATGPKKGRTDILFDYVRQKETDKWKSWEWTGEAEGPVGHDY
jgi:tetratricopeptide (TPR) repeat protein